MNETIRKVIQGIIVTALNITITPGLATLALEWCKLVYGIQYSTEVYLAITVAALILIEGTVISLVIDGRAFKK